MHRRIFSAVVLYAIILILVTVLFFGRILIRRNYHYYESRVIIQLNHVEYKSEPQILESLTIPSVKKESIEEPPVGSEIERDEVRKGYDEYAWHPARLGCGVGKEFWNVPLSWQMKWNKTSTALP